MDEQNTQKTAGAADTKEKVTAAMSGLEGYLAPIFEKFPHIPENGRKSIVEIVPWLALIFGVLSVIALLGAGGLGMIGSMLNYGIGIPALLHILAALLSAVLMLMSFNGLKAKTKRGWNLAFYSEVVGVAAGVLSLTTGYMGSIVGTVIGAVIGFWLLFEIRSYYQ